MDEKYMRLALKLAKNGMGKVNPNPLVGATIVKNGLVIGQGYHAEYGKSHAEINAFNSAVEDVTGASMYVTLEPCSHYGKTPPCTDKIIEKKISRVIIGAFDPNPMVAGKGIEKLRRAGIEVVTGILEEECKKINEVFMKYIVEKKPYVILKSAMSLDGKIATSFGESKWITGEESRLQVHELRNCISAIMVGVDTVIKDNPKLTCRIKDGRNPIRIVVDSTLRIPMKSKVISDLSGAKTIIATTDRADACKASMLKALGIRVLTTKAKDGRVDLQELMVKLGEISIDSILLEGGSTLNFSAIKEGIVDKVLFYISPQIFGGENAKTPVGGAGIAFLKDSFKVQNITSTLLGNDILLQGYLKKGGCSGVYRNS